MAEGWDLEATGAGPVEFEIGMRWAQLWRLAWRPWVPAAFLPMLGPADGLVRTRLGVTGAGPVVRQLWRSEDAVQRWARDSGASHQPPWARFAREAGDTATWGIWHRVRDV